jgi:DHA1 family bicyclomycin/chloramphenicol resistance-like MFS transporter
LLTIFTLLLAIAVGIWLQESHPLHRRIPFAPKTLLAGYASFGRDRVFWPLVIASSVNFGALFLYIASAPRLVRELLGLSALGFPWLFVPVVIGLVSGAWISGRLAGRRGVAVTVGWGYAAMLFACALHLLLALWLPAPRLPWSMLPLMLQGVGVQLAFPTLTLLLLDRFPHQRGGISSVQAFASLALTALIAGVLSPLLSIDMLGLALGASALTTIGLLAWCIYRRLVRNTVEPPNAPLDIATELQAEIAEPM